MQRPGGKILDRLAPLRVVARLEDPTAGVVDRDEEPFDRWVVDPVEEAGAVLDKAPEVSLEIGPHPVANHAGPAQCEPQGGPDCTLRAVGGDQVRGSE